MAELYPGLDITPARADPKQYDVMAIVHRTGAVLSPAAQLMIELATKHIQSITEPV